MLVTVPTIEIVGWVTGHPRDDHQGVQKGALEPLKEPLKKVP